MSNLLTWERHNDAIAKGVPADEDQAAFQEALLDDRCGVDRVRMSVTDFFDDGGTGSSSGYSNIRGSYQNPSTTIMY